MQYRIYKYELEMKSGEQKVEMFSGGKFLSANIQRIKGYVRVVMWFVVDVDNLQKDYTFYLVETGSKFNDSILLKEYLATVQINLDSPIIPFYVLHIFKGG